MIRAFILAATFAISFAPDSLRAQEAEACPKLIASNGPRIFRAALAANEVALNFVGHSTFLIESPKGIRIATDYNDYVRPPLPLDAITMNKAHSTHFTHVPDTSIPHVLRGWNDRGVGPVQHDVTVGDVRIRNVPTNIRRWDGGGTEYSGNSMFVFEAADLCIAHLGHLHHPLEPSHLKALGRIDVVLVPVDGGVTLDTEGMIEVLRGIGAPLVVPMHFYGPSTLNRFLDQAREHFEIERATTGSIILSRESLPKKPKVLVLPGRHF